VSSDVAKQVKLQLLEMRSPTARVSHSLLRFSDLRKNPNTRPGGKTYPGYAYIKDKDHNRIAIKLLETDWSGQFSGSALWVMATEIQDLLRIRDISFNDKWSMGRVLISALCYAGVYRQDQEARGAEGGRQRPLFLVRTGEDLDTSKRLVKKTRHHPFPNWTGPTDDDGNRLVRPCKPCPPHLEYEPTIADQPWLQAVHRLENIPFRINKALVRWAKELDTNPDTRVIPYLPPNFERDISVLEKEYEKLGIGEIEQIWDIDKKLRKKDKKANDARYKADPKAHKKLPKIRSKGYHTTPDQDEIWNDYWARWFALEDKRQRYEVRRKQFDSELATAETLLKAGKPFYQRVSVDYRGRLYLPDFSYQGSDFCRAVIEFDGAEAVDKNGWLHLLRHTANAYGEAKTFAEKIAFRLPDSNTSRYINIGLDPLSHFDDLIKADKPFCFLRSCIEIMDVATPWLKGILDGDDPEQLKRMSGETTRSKAEEWFRKVTSRYSVLDLHPMEWVDGDGNRHVSGDYHDAPDNLHYLSHLPCEIDQSNSAFQHIAQMMNDPQKFEDVLGKDVYTDVAEKLPDGLFSGLEDEGDKRKIVKLVAVPWSYGAGTRTIEKRVKKFRKENPDKIKHLEGLDDPAIKLLCVQVVDQLNSEYPLCEEYQTAVKDAVDEVNKLGLHEYVEWDTPLGFIAHQRVHGTRQKKDSVYCGPIYYQKTGKKAKDGKDDERQQGGNREVRARPPTDSINWERMRTKAPPNLVHSYDSALVHGTLWAGGRFYQLEERSDQQSPITSGATGMEINEDIGTDNKRVISGIYPYWDDPSWAEYGTSELTPEDTEHWRFPVVTIHDAFSCLASHCNEVIAALQFNFEVLYHGFDPLQRFLDSVRDGSYPLRHREYRWISNSDQFS
jgi:hypothetical protein